MPIGVHPGSAQIDILENLRAEQWEQTNASDLEAAGERDDTCMRARVNPLKQRAQERVRQVGFDAVREANPAPEIAREGCHTHGLAARPHSGLKHGARCPAASP